VPARSSSRPVKVVLRFPVIPSDVLQVFGINIEGQVLGGGPFNHKFVTMRYKMHAG
jgi:hypothetical protein